jgi:hypothetical protein
MPRNMRDRDEEFRFEIAENIGVIGQSSSGWSKEINMVSWNGKQPKLDIRDWAENHERMSRGITLHTNEALEMIKLLNNFFKDELAGAEPA